MTNYLSVFIYELSGKLESRGARSGYLRLGLLLSKDKPLLLEVRGHPENPALADQSLWEEMREIPLPQLQSGAVAFVIHFLPSESTPIDESLPAPFSEFSAAELSPEDLQIAQGQSFPAEELEKYYSRETIKKSLAGRLVDWLLNRSPGSMLVPRRDSEQPYLPFAADQVDVETLNRWVEASPGEAEVLGARAEFFLAQDRYAEALADCQQALALAPDLPRIHAIAACCHAALEDTAAALSSFDRAIALDPEYAFARFRRAQILIELEALQEAQRELETLIQFRPHDTLSRLLLSQLYHHQDETERASEQADVLERLDPHDVTTIGWRSYLDRQLDRFDDSERHLQALTRALRYEPDDLAARFERAVWRSITGDWQLLIEDCDALLRAKPDDAMTLGLRACGYLELDDPQAALADIERAIELGFDSTQNLMTRIRCQLALEDTESVAADLEQILSEEPDNVYALCLKGDFCRATDEPEEALAHYQSALRFEPDSTFLLEKLAHALFDLNRTREALETCEACIHLDPESPQHYFTKSWILFQINQLEDALAAINLAIELDPHNAVVYFHRAHIMLALTDRGQALEDLNTALTHSPDFGQALALRARIHQDNTDYELAESDYNELVSQFPDNFYAYSLRASLRTHMGRDDLAQKDIRSAIEINPSAAEAVLRDQEMSRAESHFRREQYEDAIEGFTEIIEQDEEFLPARHYRATSYWYSERFVEAIDDYSQILEQLSDSDGDVDGFRLAVLGSRGQVYAELGEYDLAMRDLNQVIEADSELAGPILKAYARSGRGLAQVGLERPTEAEADFQVSVSIAPDNAWVHYNQGLFYFQQRRLKEARVCFELALVSENPKLTPRKRAKANSFLDSCNQDG